MLNSSLTFLVETKTQTYAAYLEIGLDFLYMSKIWFYVN